MTPSDDASEVFPYTSAQAFGAALTARLKYLAGVSGPSASQLRRQFAYDRLLARLFIASPQEWILKGGVSMIARLISARHTADVDLVAAVDSTDAALTALHTAAARDLGDFFTFRFETPRALVQPPGAATPPATTRCRPDRAIPLAERTRRGTTIQYRIRVIGLTGTGRVHHDAIMQVTDDTPAQLDPAGAVPVLWICGPPGVGKTTIGWKIFKDLVGTGVLTGYVDIDQLGNCYPDPPNDRDRHHLQSRNLNAVIETYRLAGAQCVVVSGVVDPKAGPHLDAIAGADVTVVRLRADLDELKTRFLGRGTAADLIDDALAEAESYDHIDVATVVDTTGHTADEVVDLVHTEIDGWPKPSTNQTVQPSQVKTDTSGPVMLLFGPTGVGKSTVGWQVWMSTLGTGAMSAFVDLDQIGFLRPVPLDDPQNHRVKAQNLTAIWSEYRSAGVQTLVVVGPVEDRDALNSYADALPGADLTLVRLHADPDTLTERLLARGRGEGVPLPGDELAGLSEASLRRIADSAAATAEATQNAKLGDVSVDTSGQTPEDIAAAIFAQIGIWP